MTLNVSQHFSAPILLMVNFIQKKIKKKISRPNIKNIMVRIFLNRKSEILPDLGQLSQTRKWDT